MMVFSSGSTMVVYFITKQPAFVATDGRRRFDATRVIGLDFKFLQLVEHLAVLPQKKSTNAVLQLAGNLIKRLVACFTIV